MKIPAIIGGRTVRNEQGIPSVEGGTLGEMDTDDLRLNEFTIDNDNETTVVTEYWQGEELVHRSVNVKLKKSLLGECFQAKF